MPHALPDAMPNPTPAPAHCGRASHPAPRPPRAPARPRTTAPAPALRDALGRPLRDLRISVTDRCNFRCDYCMPKSAFGADHRFLPPEALLDFGEIERLARLFVACGVRKIRLTGGEPLLRPDLPRLVARLRAIDGLSDLALTTNGFLLDRYARALADAGLHRVTVSLDSLHAATFASASGTAQGTLPRVLAGIEAAVDAGLGPVKVNCVVRRRDNLEEVAELARHFRSSPVVLRFIEYMDVGTVNDWTPQGVVTAAEILARIGADATVRPLPASQPGEVARRYGYAAHPGEFGVISSVSEPFCGECNRARLSADGHLLTCLFAGGGLDLRAALRAGDDDPSVSQLLRGAWQQRQDRYSQLRAELQRGQPRRRRLEMYQVGG